MDRKKIIEAMETIKAVCERYPLCASACPFLVENTGTWESNCYIRRSTPSNWEINEADRFWRAYKKDVKEEEK